MPSAKPVQSVETQRDSCSRRAIIFPRWAIIVAGILLVWSTWFLFQQWIVPHTIQKIYLGQATPAVLNTLIKGQAERPLDFYLQWWRKKSTTVEVLLLLLSLGTLLLMIPHARRHCGRLRAWGVSYLARQGLPLNVDDPSRATRHHSPPMGRFRVAFVATWVAAFALVELASVVSFTEWWPFNPSQMYSQQHKDTFKRYEVYGTIGGEIILVAGKNPTLSTRLGALKKDPIALRKYMLTLHRMFQDQHRERPPLQALQLRHVTWKLHPHWNTENSVVDSRLIFEVRGLDRTQLAGATDKDNASEAFR